MTQLISMLEKKINGIALSMFANGVILFLLGILIIWTDFMIRIVVGVMVFVIAYAFFYGSYKLWSLKQEIKKHLS